MPDQSKIKIFVKNTTWVFAGKIISQGFSFIASILVIRKLAVEVFGTYNFLINVFLILSLISTSQVKAVFTRYIPELIQIRDKEKIRKLLFYGLVISISTLVILVFSIFIFQNQFADLFHIDNINSYLFSFIIYVITAYFRSLLNTVLFSLLLHKQVSIIQMVNSVIRPILWIYNLSIINVNLLLQIEATLATFFVIISSIVIGRYYIKFEGKPNIQGNVRISRKRVYKYGMFALFNELGAGIIGRSSDYLIISAIGNPYFVGLYAFANKFYNYIYKIIPLKEILTIIRPLFFKKFSVKYDKEEFIQIFNFMIKVMLPVYLLPAIYFLIFGKSIIEFVFDPKYLNAYIVSCIVLFDNVYIGLFYPVNPTVLHYERMDLSLYSKITVLFSIIAGLYGMKYYGLVGIALATMAGNYLKVLFVIYFMREQADMVFKLKEIRNYLFISVCLIALFYFPNTFIKNIWGLLFYSIIFLITSVVLMIFYHPFNDKDLILLNKIGKSSSVINKISPLILNIHKLKPRFN